MKESLRYQNKNLPHVFHYLHYHYSTIIFAKQNSNTFIFWNSSIPLFPRSSLSPNPMIDSPLHFYIYRCHVKLDLSITDIKFCHCLWTHLPSPRALFHPTTTIWIIYKHHYPHIIHGPRTQVPSKYFSFKTTSCYFSVNSMPLICFIWIHLLIGST